MPVNSSRVRDHVDTVRFTSTIPPPWLDLLGISTGDFHETLAVLFGPNAAGLSSTTIARRKADWWDEYDQAHERNMTNPYLNSPTAKLITDRIRDL